MIHKTLSNLHTDLTGVFTKIASQLESYDFKHAFSLEIIKPDRPSKFVNLGPHPPRLWPEDVDRVHDIWLELSEKLGLGSNLHHRDIVGVALRRMEADLQGEDRLKIVEEMKREMGKG